MSADYTGVNTAGSRAVTVGLQEGNIKARIQISVARREEGKLQRGVVMIWPMNISILTSISTVVECSSHK